MKDTMMENLIHPVKSKLLLEVYDRGTATAKDLIRIHNDIPQATLYRYLKRMVADGILKVVDENPVRGVIEKVYAMTEDFANDSKQALLENSGEVYYKMFQQYVLGITKQFQDYCSREDINLIKDQSGFSIAPVYVTSEELLYAMTQIGEIINQLYHNESTPERKLQTIGLIITPPNRMD